MGAVSGKGSGEEPWSQWPEERGEPSQSQPLPAHSLPPRRTEEEDEEELEETAQEKKLRLAKLYLEQLRQQGEPVHWAGEGQGLCPRLPAAAPAACWVTDAGPCRAARVAGAGCPGGGWLGDEQASRGGWRADLQGALA